MPRPLALHRTLPSLSDTERGALLDAGEVAAKLFSGKVSRKWIFANVPVQYRHKVGRMVLFYEGEIRWWIEQLRQVA